VDVQRHLGDDTSVIVGCALACRVTARVSGDAAFRSGDAVGQARHTSLRRAFDAKGSAMTP
jgi:hypothetical protein